MGTASLQGTDSINAAWPPALYGEQSCSWDVARQSPKSPQQSRAQPELGSALFLLTLPSRDPHARSEPKPDSSWMERGHLLPAQKSCESFFWGQMLAGVLWPHW